MQKNKYHLFSKDLFECIQLFDDENTTFEIIKKKMAQVLNGSDGKNLFKSRDSFNRTFFHYIAQSMNCNSGLVYFLLTHKNFTELSEEERCDFLNCQTVIDKNTYDYIDIENGETALHLLLRQNNIFFEEKEQILRIVCRSGATMNLLDESGNCVFKSFIGLSLKAEDLDGFFRELLRDPQYLKSIALSSYKEFIIIATSLLNNNKPFILSMPFLLALCSHPDSNDIALFDFFYNFHFREIDLDFQDQEGNNILHLLLNNDFLNILNKLKLVDRFLSLGTDIYCGNNKYEIPFFLILKQKDIEACFKLKILEEYIHKNKTWFKPNNNCITPFYKMKCLLDNNQLPSEVKEFFLKKREDLFKLAVVEELASDELFDFLLPDSYKKVRSEIFHYLLTIYNIRKKQLGSELVELTKMQNCFATWIEWFALKGYQDSLEVKNKQNISAITLIANKNEELIKTFESFFPKFFPTYNNLDEIEVNYRDENGNSPLSSLLEDHYLNLKDKIRLIKQFLSLGADIHCPNPKTHMTPLFLLLNDGAIDPVEKLTILKEYIHKKKLWFYRNLDSITPFFTVKSLLDEGRLPSQIKDFFIKERQNIFELALTEVHANDELIHFLLPDRYRKDKKKPSPDIFHYLLGVYGLKKSQLESKSDENMGNCFKTWIGWLAREGYGDFLEVKNEGNLSAISLIKSEYEELIETFDFYFPKSFSKKIPPLNEQLSETIQNPVKKEKQNPVLKTATSSQKSKPKESKEKVTGDKKIPSKEILKTIKKSNSVPNKDIPVKTKKSSKNEQSSKITKNPVKEEKPRSAPKKVTIPEKSKPKESKEKVTGDKKIPSKEILKTKETSAPVQNKNFSIPLINQENTSETTLIKNKYEELVEDSKFHFSQPSSKNISSIEKKNPHKLPGNIPLNTEKNTNSTTTSIPVEEKKVITDKEKNILSQNNQISLNEEIYIPNKTTQFMYSPHWFSSPVYSEKQVQTLQETSVCIKLPGVVIKFMESISEEGFQIYPFGGIVRDEDFNDVDFITNMSPESFKQFLAKEQPWDAQQKGIYINAIQATLFKFFKDGLPFEVLCKPDLDLNRLGMALDMTGNAVCVIDTKGCVKYLHPQARDDLKHRTIRLIPQQPELIHILRAIGMSTRPAIKDKKPWTFCEETDYKIKAFNTGACSKEYTILLRPLDKLFLRGNAAASFIKLKEYNLLELLFGLTSSIFKEKMQMGSFESFEDYLINELSKIDQSIATPLENQRAPNIFNVLPIFYRRQIEKSIINNSEKRGTEELAKQLIKSYPLLNAFSGKPANILVGIFSSSFQVLSELKLSQENYVININFFNNTKEQGYVNNKQPESLNNCSNN